MEPNQPLDPRAAELIGAVAAAVEGLIVAVGKVDHPEIAAQVGELLRAVTRYSNALAERPSDEGLRRAVAALNRSA